MPDMQPDARLELPVETMRALGYQVVEMLISHLTDLRHEPVTPRADRPTMEALLREPLPRQGTPPEAVLAQFQRDVLDHIMHLDHPRFFAFVPSPSNFVSVMADALAAGFNIFAGTWLEAAGPTEVELVTIDWLRQLCGLPSTAGGLFVSGGSVANLTALAVARHTVLDDGLDGAVVYCSDQAHSSIERALRILGFQPSQLHKLPADDGYRLPVGQLARAVSADRAAGKRPFCVVANAGTTNTGAVDRLPALAAFCHAEGLWLHADGAYGAAAVLTENGARLLEGLGLADSLTLDPHKWLFQPYEIGCVLVRDAYLMREAFRILPEYLKDIDRAAEEVNFCDYGIQLTRGARALKLWLSLKVFGLDAFRAAVDRGIELAEFAQEVVASLPGWQIVTQAQMGIVTFRYAPAGRSGEALDALNRALVDEMIADGYAMVSSTVLQGRTVLRMCTINPRTTEGEVRETLRRLARFAEEHPHD